ncbi:hypothetical protein HGRIS_014002 [Hohenbuehelia grisea]|uniref:Uncharacterized protein n=1 Tax=Hohenbuehelia grisea TaxID=104357 RepID=A0ABR3JS37_9AGAR
MENQSKGLLNLVASRAKGWLRRGAIKEEVQCLEKNLRSCRLRFIASTSTPKEYDTIVHHQEQLDHLLHMEDLVSYMLVRNIRSNEQSFPSLDVYYEPDKIDWQFIHRQVLRISGALKGTWTELTAEPTKDFEPPRGELLGTPHFR